MAIQTIEIQAQLGQMVVPTVRFSGLAEGNIWEYSGLSTGFLSDSKVEPGRTDVNRLAEDTASRLAAKVNGRGVEIEVLIDPFVPPIAVAGTLLQDLALTIAENASASVEPGPGKVMLCSWWDGKHVGIDAIGKAGHIPPEIRVHLGQPGFTTKVADWDTGFGLWAASDSARSIGATVEVLEAHGDIVFRLSIPLRRATPLSPPEHTIILPDLGDAGGTSGPSASSQPADSLFIYAEVFHELEFASHAFA